MPFASFVRGSRSRDMIIVSILRISRSLGTPRRFRGDTRCARCAVVTPGARGSELLIRPPRRWISSARPNIEHSRLGNHGRPWNKHGTSLPSAPLLHFLWFRRFPPTQSPK